jgi:predicted nucleic-acid-binding protein
MKQPLADGPARSKVTVDTNVLIRAVVQDDRKQAEAATALLKNAKLIAVTLPCLCEFVWVLHRVYRFKRSDISAALDALLSAGNVVMDRPAVDAGLAMRDSGGDFADGLIAYEGRWLGGETFVSFDKKAVLLIRRQGLEATLLT